MINYGLRKRDMQVARHLLGEPNFSHDTMMAYLRQKYTEAKYRHYATTNESLRAAYESYFESLQPGQSCLTLWQYAEAMGWQMTE